MNDEKISRAMSPPTGTEPRPVEGSNLRELKSEDLLRGATEILIRHGREHYRLRSTSKGKLILTK